MDVASQVQAARTKALYVPAPSLAVLPVRGADRRTWLNGLVTCDVTKLEDGQAAYGLAVAQKGRILADLVLVADRDRVLVVAPASEMGALRAAFDRYLVMEDAEMGDAGELTVGFVHGPGAAAAFDVARAAGATGGPLDVTGLGGAIVLTPKAAEALVQEKLGAVAALGDDAGWDALRLERGVPRFGVDFDGTMYPQEASLEKRAVSFDKGCYLGQEVVCMLEMRGHVKRKLMPLVLDAGEVPLKGASVTTTAGDVVGEVTSAALSPTLGAPVALAMIKYAHAKAGEKLTLGPRAATIAERPA
jgi:tRNA-modifying protein YgfZ